MCLGRWFRQPALSIIAIFFFRKDDRAESFLATLPAFAGKLLHVSCLVILIYDFQTEDGLNDILKGDNALETAVFVNDESHLLVLLEQFLPDMAAGILLFEE